MSYGIKQRRNAKRPLATHQGLLTSFRLPKWRQIIQHLDAYGEIGAPPREWGQRYVDRHGVPYLRLTAAAQDAAVMVMHTVVARGPGRFVGILLHSPRIWSECPRTRTETGSQLSNPSKTTRLTKKV